MTSYTLKPARPQAPTATQPFHTFTFPDGRLWTEFHRNDKAYFLRFPNLADFEVSLDGRRVTGYPVLGAERATVEHLYINQVLPLALSRQGRLAYHASAVTVPGGSVAFLGRSGSGKSTLATQFARSGERFLTDDGLLLMKSGGGYRVTPNHPSIRLWNDSQEALVPTDAAVAPPVSFTNKARVLAGDELPHCHEPRPLLAAYVLEGEASGTDVAIRTASMAETVMAWIRNSFLLDMTDPALVARHFENTSLLAEAIPTFHLDYPRQYDRLPDVQAAIIKHVSGLGDAV